MKYRRKAPTLDNEYLCWEPKFAEASWLLMEVKGLLDRDEDLSASLPRLSTFTTQLEAMVEEAQEEQDRAMEEYKAAQECHQKRAVNERQMQEAVSFLHEVLQGKKEATMEQIAAARCFMRAE